MGDVYFWDEQAWEYKPVTVRGRVVLAGFEYFPLFATQGVGIRKDFIEITEAQTGQTIGAGGATVEEATENAKVVLKEWVRRRLEEHTTKCTTMHGQSPWVDIASPDPV